MSIRVFVTISRTDISPRGHVSDSIETDPIILSVNYGYKTLKDSAKLLLEEVFSEAVKQGVLTEKPEE